MDAVHDTGIFDLQEQETLNQYRHFKGVHSIGDVVCSDGHTIDLTMLIQQDRAPPSDSDRTRSQAMGQDDPLPYTGGS